MREVDELRPLTAARLLTLWRECGDMAAEKVTVVASKRIETTV